MHYSAAHGIAAQHSTAHYRAPQCCCQLGSAATWHTHLRSRLAHARRAPMTGKRCDGGGIKFANSCDVIKQHFPCKMCWKSQGSDQPCYVSMMNAPPEKHPGDCMIEGTHTTHACNTAHTARYAQHTLYAHTLCTLHPHHPHHTTLRTTHATLRTPSTLCPCLCCGSIICTAPASLLCCALHCRSRAGSSCVTISCVIISYHHVWLCVVWVCVCVV